MARLAAGLTTLVLAALPAAGGLASPEAPSQSEVVCTVDDPRAIELSGLPRDALAGTQYGLARTVVFRRVSRGGTGLFEFPAYLGFSVEAGNAWQTRDEVELDGLTLAGSFFFGAESPLGPIYLAAGFAEQGERALYLLLGRTF